MAQRDLYVDTDVGEIVTSAFDSTPKQLPPMVQGDILSLRIYLLKRSTTFLLGATPYLVLNNSDLTIRVGIGPKDGTPGSSLYTSQFTWDRSSDNTYFSGTFPLNTDAIAQQIGTAESKDLWFEIEITDTDGPQTVFQRKVSVQAEVIESASVEVPPGQVALTTQDGDARYLRRTGLKAIYLEDTLNDGQFIVLYNENGSLKVDKVTGTPPDLA